MAQLEAISLQGAVSALVAARQHLLAARACRQLGLDVSQVRSWAWSLTPLCWQLHVAWQPVTSLVVTVWLLSRDHVQQSGLPQPIKHGHLYASCIGSTCHVHRLPQKRAEAFINQSRSVRAQDVGLSDAASQLQPGGSWMMHATAGPAQPPE